MKDNRRKCRDNNEDGFALVAALLILLLLVVLGTSAVTNSNIDIQIATNEKQHELAFYSAELGRSYVEVTPVLYGANNLDTADGADIPIDDALDEITTELGDKQAFTGKVRYLSGGTSRLRGMGYDVGSGVTAHSYLLDVTGTGPKSSVSKVQAEFFRIGL